MENNLSIATLRIIDANNNRACEGLRTLEDISRFALNRQDLCSAYKHIRHQLTACLIELAGHNLARTRDVVGDVGTSVSTETEKERATLAEIASAAANRVQQALRCIEECCKLTSETAAAKVESLRYWVYSQNAILLTSLQRDSEFIANARLYVLVDCKLEPAEFEDRLSAISAAGVDLIQIRDKDADAHKLSSYANAALKILEPSKTRVIMNDRVDIAAVTSVHGVHLGQSDIDIKDARKLLPVTSWIGVSTHGLDQYRLACASGADYVGCGPTFPSQTKQFETFAGLEYLRAVAAEQVCPAFAIGGINTENVELVLATGIKRVAVAGAIWAASAPATAAAALCECLR